MAESKYIKVLYKREDGALDLIRIRHEDKAVIEKLWRLLLALKIDSAQVNRDEATTFVRGLYRGQQKRHGRIFLRKFNRSSEL